MTVLPPGTLLQLMYVQKRLQLLPPGHFIEVGPGAGELSSLLLQQGWSGCAYDLDANTVTKLHRRFAKDIAAQRYMAVQGDYLTAQLQPTDLIISCMVMEHLDDDGQRAFLDKSAQTLKQGGLMIGLVPASPEHWGIEDEIAGHYRRYTRASMAGLLQALGWQLTHIAGLTYPLSNLLLPLSNFLVTRSEQSKLILPLQERTKQSGRRQVRFKTHFSPVWAILLNRYTLYPLSLLQNSCHTAKYALVLYFEAYLS